MWFCCKWSVDNAYDPLPALWLWEGEVKVKGRQVTAWTLQGLDCWSCVAMYMSCSTAVTGAQENEEKYRDFHEENPTPDT